MKSLQDSLNVVERLKAPTPKFFKKLQVLGIILAAVSGTLMNIESKGIELPAVVQHLANWSTIIAGVVTTLVGQLTIDLEAYRKENALS